MTEEVLSSQLLEDWYLVDEDGQLHQLPMTMVFMGREECDVVVESQTVDKRHAVITFDHYLDRFKIKDLSTINGTFVNEARIPEQEYVTLEHMDSLRLGYDILGIQKNPLSPAETMPHWAMRDGTHLAECEGCIAEQQITHTCEEVNHNHLPEMYDSDNHSANHSLGSNTWPRKRVRNMQHVADVFNDEDLNTIGLTDTCPSHSNEGYGDQLQNRILRGKGAAPENLPPELETVKKCTPLYGQPEWWGEDDACKEGETTHDDEPRLQAGRPSSLILAKGIEEQSHHSAFSSPHKEITPERDKSRSPSCKMTTSMSKDSLLSHSISCQNTPDTPSEKNGIRDQSSFSDKDSSPVKDDITPTQKSVKGHDSMAFTVELGDDTPRMKIEGSLSAFVPSKIRRSFRERSEKSKSSSKESSPCAPEQELQDLSPTTQTKIEDLWNTENSNKRPRSSGTNHASEEGDNMLDSIPVKGPKTPKMKKSKVSSSLNILKPKSASSKIKNSSTSHSTAQVSDSASYLIDRMFTEEKIQPGRKADIPSDTTNPFTEHVLYKEARNFNKNSRARDEQKVPEVVHREARNVSQNNKNKDRKVQEEENIGNYNSSTYKIMKSKIFRNLSQDHCDSLEVQPSEEPEVQTAVKEVDKNSEAGTYTIDGEEMTKEEEDARNNIETVFGIALNEGDSPRGREAGSGSPIGVRDITLCQLKRDVRELEMRWGQNNEMGNLVDIDSEEMPDLIDESPVVSIPQDAPEWVSQWATLTNQKARSTTDETMEKSPLSQKQSSGLSRKRPGTGRRLPSIPPEKSSPSSSESSSKISDKLEDSAGDRSSPNSLKLKTVKISSHVASRYQDTDSESVSRTKFDSVSDCASLVNGHSKIPVQTPSSVASMETDLLLRDTETVMAAMEARMGTKSHPVQNGVPTKLENDSDTETSSTVAVANGDDSYVKPTYYDSPRQNLSKSKLKTNSVTSRPPLARTKSAGGKQCSDKPPVLRRETTFTKTQSVVSDLVSEIDYLDSGGNISDMSSDYTESSQGFNRKGSKGKGTITMTRPNRAFQLRRQRAEEPESPKSSASTLSTSTRLSLGTSLNTSARSSNRNRSRPNSMGDRQLDSAKSEVSLGAQIAKKSQENLKASQALDRKDGGRHSLRMLRTKSSSDAVLHTSTDSVSSRKTNLKNIKSNLKTTSSTSDSYGLSVTGVRTNKPLSQPSSRSNSPKSAERNAWRRRKEYDPRKAVAEAKAKAKEVKPNTTYSSLHNTKKQMARSQSFTNTSDLTRSSYHGRSRGESTSSAEDLSQVTSEASDTFDEQGPKRSFLPYSNPMQHSRLYHSADEDEVRLVKSTQDLSRSMLGSNPNMSAFTPPPPKSASPVSPPPPNQHYHRRSFEVRDKNNGSQGALSRKYSDTSLTQSYDNIIVSSIYQLSLKLKTAMDRTMQKLRESQRLDSSSPSPIDDLLNTSSSSDMPAWKSANQELAGILKNLRKIEHYVHVVDTVLFPDDEQGSEVSGLSRGEKRRYLQEIERIRSELAGFQPIEHADVWKASESHDDVAESDCEELGGDDYY
ncbi:hypothetical protein ScPMuIL_014367 [Solemya velum]